MIDERFVATSHRFDPPPDAFERLRSRRDRKRRNQRIAAGVVGIAVFVAAVWIVMSGLSFDRSTPAVPGSETGTQTAPPPARASAAPDVVRQGQCSFGPSAWRLELTDEGDEIGVRFVIHGSLDHPWRFVLRHGRAGSDPFNYDDGRVFFEGIKTGPYLSPEVEVRRSVPDLEGDDGFAAKAVDQQTGQLCRVHTRIG